jgi:predicted TPR repeat methyltransferase
MSSESTLNERYDALLARYHAGDLAEAEALGQALLDDAPQHAGALQLMGVLQARQGNFSAALDWLDRAVAADPQAGSAHHNRANVLLALERHGEAVAAYDRASAFGHESAQAQNNRGTALQAMHRFDAAMYSFERALELQPDFAEALLNRGELLLQIGRHDEGVESLQRARAAGADDEKIAFTLASLGVGPVAEAAPPTFVRELFDQYAPGFDAHLVDHLGYRAPELIAEAVAALAPPPLAIADLGCGTGLCGGLLRPLASQLDGVDLSAKMLEQARARGHYDALDCAELTGWLRERPQRYDVAVAADVLIYFGALEPVLDAVHGALKPGGGFVFTVEAAEEAGEEDFVLRPTRRYAHRRSYLERLAGRHGFQLRRLEAQSLRNESRAEVAGWLVVLQRD